MDPLTLLNAESGSQERLRAYIVYALLGTVFFMPLNIFLMEACFAVSTLLAATYTWKHGMGLWRRMPLFTPAAAFVVVALVSLIGAPKMLNGVVFYIFTIVQYFILYNLVVSFIRGERERKLLLYAFLIGAFLMVLYGFYQYSHMLGLRNEEWVDTDAFPLLQRRMYSTLYNPNLLSAFLLMVMGIAASCTIWTDHRRRRLLYVGLFTIFTLCLILTYSRGAWLSVFAMVFFFGLVWDKRVWLLFLVVPVVLVFYHGGVVTRIMSLFANNEDTSVSMRIDMWECTLDMIKDHLFLGIGWGAYQYVYPLYNELIEEAGIIIYHAHNMYLDIMAETGLLGFAMYMWFFFGNAWYGLKVLKGKASPFSKCLAMSAASAVFTIAVSGISDYDLFATQISLTLWLVFAMFANVYCEEY